MKGVGKKFEFLTSEMPCKGATYSTMMFGLLNETSINNEITVVALLLSTYETRSFVASARN